MAGRFEELISDVGEDCANRNRLNLLMIVRVSALGYPHNHWFV